MHICSCPTTENAEPAGSSAAGLLEPVDDSAVLSIHTEQQLQNGTSAGEQCKLCGVTVPLAHVTEKYGTYWGTVILSVLCSPINVIGAAFVCNALNGWALITVVPGFLMPLWLVPLVLMDTALPCFLRDQDRDQYVLKTYGVARFRAYTVLKIGSYINGAFSVVSMFLAPPLGRCAPEHNCCDVKR